MASETVKHDYHLVEPSPWPMISSLAVAILGVGVVVYLKGLTSAESGLQALFFARKQPWLGLIGLVMMLYAMIGWWWDVLKEARQGDHTPVVNISLRYGVVLFIFQEMMLFAAWFWIFFELAFFHGRRSENSGGALESTWESWPPPGIETIDPFGLPLLNTLILLLSGTTITWAHHALIEGNRKEAKWGLALTILLGLCFVALQALEYMHVPFSLSTNLYGSTFFMATGFHGFHVIVGVIFLAVCYFRLLAGGFTPEKHVGFESAAWYWHFVDVVWLFLFAFIYVAYQ